MKEADRQRAIRQKLAGLGDSPARPPGLLHTGFAALDQILGGGLPRGEMLEIFGPVGCGKSTLAMQIAACVQRAGLTVAWIDADHTFDPAWAERLGLDSARMPLAQPDSAEEGFEIARTLAASGAVDLIIVDSAAALVPKLEIALRVGSAPGLHSRVMASELRKLSHAIGRADVCALFLNQMRNRVDSPGGGETSAGGTPLKLYAAVRLMPAPAKGQRVSLRVWKNQLAATVNGRELQWRHGVGFVESP